MSPHMLMAVMIIAAVGVMAANNPDEKMETLSNGRKYAVVNPRVSGTNMPIVVYYYGRGGNCNQEGETRDLRVAMENAHMAALVIGACSNGDWDYGGDVGYTRDVVQDAKKKYSVDPTKVFVIGFSMGAAMATSVACSAQDIVIGVGVDACGGGCDSLKTKMGVLGVQGRSDPICGPPGGATSVFNSFVRAMGCDAGSGDTRKMTCQGKPVELYVLDGGHQWFESGSFSISATTARILQTLMGNPQPPASSTCADSGGENQAVSLSCPSNQVIASVDFASYGTPTGSCSAGFSKSSCDASTSVSVVQSACVGKQSCSVTASNSVFGDPCMYTGKHLAVKVACGSNTDNTCGIADEGASLSLGCAAGKKITKINFASYGVPQGDCLHPSTGNCHASSSQKVMEDACLNKNSCSVAASNSVFGDPCAGTIKKLAAILTCA